jgi:hypothetical protein
MKQAPNITGFLSGVVYSGMLLLATLQATQATAQWTDEKTLHFNSNDVKHYAVDPFEGTDQYMMAGTMFDYAGTTGDNAVHWMFIDNSGMIVQSKVINDPAFDERVIGTHYLNGNEALIVASRSNLASPGAIDGIEILRIDGGGNLLPSSRIINSVGGSAYFNLYPLGSLQYDNRYLFICGYATNTTGTPDLTTNKVAFVMKYDMNTNSVVDNHFMEGSLVAAGSYDFDMATRMKIVNSGIWVGGSFNDPINKVGFMRNQIIDPNTLNDVYPPQSIGMTYGSPAGSYYESSFDVKEDDAGDLFVFGNTLYIDNFIAAPYVTPRPMFFHVTGTQPNLIPYSGGNERWFFNGYDYAWGVNIVPGKDNSTVILSGMETNRSCNEDYPNKPTSFDNINPFLTEMRLRMIGNNINVTSYYWNTVLSISGTGSMLTPNSYFMLGNPGSNLAVGPITTVRDLQSTQDIFLSCPVWDGILNKLNIKWIRTDGNAELSSCPWASACEINSFYYFTSNGNGCSNTIDPAVENTNSFSDDLFFPDAQDNCATGVYKGTGITDVNATLTVSLAPNPAHDFIRIKFSGKEAMNEHLEIKLTDLSGRNLGTLFAGMGSKIPATLNLPQLIQGLYFVTIIKEQQKVKTIPLSIR